MFLFIFFPLFIFIWVTKEAAVTFAQKMSICIFMYTFSVKCFFPRWQCGKTSACEVFAHNFVCM